MADKSRIELLVSQIRKAMIKVLHCNGEYMFKVICEFFKEIGSIMRRDDTNFIRTSVWNFGIYEIGFGWGKPICGSFPAGALKN
ncbi:unnamed protein product [Malus baccata var. baccata]